MSGERLIKVVLSTYRHLYCLRIALGHFFFRLVWSDRPKFWAFSKQERLMWLNHFLFEIILVIQKMSIVRAQRKAVTKPGTYVSQCLFLIQVCKC